MATLIYSPGVKVVIDTVAHGLIDVSEDIADGSLTHTENESSEFRITLTNHRRKYDGVFTPNDRITVEMRRLTWVREFTGYLTQVPYFSVMPKNISLVAHDTLKFLKYRYWDPGTTAGFNLLHENLDQQDVDSGMKGRMIRLLTEVAKWPANRIHIGQLPLAWLEHMNSLRETLSSQVQVDVAALGAGATINGGQGVASIGERSIPNTGIKATGLLPVTSGRVTVATMANTGEDNMVLTNERKTAPTDEWYCAMRWPFWKVNENFRATRAGSHWLTADEERRSKEWWAGKRLYLVHQNTQQVIAVRCADFGPEGQGDRSIAISQQALSALGAKDGDFVSIRFAPDGSTLGKITLTTGPTHPIAETPTTGEGSHSPDTATISWTPRSNLKGNVAAARDFIKNNWSPPTIGGYANRTTASGAPSQHAQGLALDIMVNGGGKFAEGNEIALGNAVAQWFAENPKAFGVDYIIWSGKINTGDNRGWRDYKTMGKTGRWLGATLGHYDHVHISFNNTGQTALGQMGVGSFRQSSMSEFQQVFTGGLTSGTAGVSGAGESPFGQLVNIQWQPTTDPISEGLSGPRAMMNDAPVLTTVEALCMASMRSWMAAPNGDFIAWFPDYFGHYGLASVMEIEPIELTDDGFTMMWSDEHLKTHIYTAGSEVNATSSLGEAAVTFVSQQKTMGIATVEYPEIMAALFNLDLNDPASSGWADGQAIIARFGARPEFQPMGLVYGPEAEFWTACHHFMLSWSQQWSMAIDLTFMPELFPGMLARLSAYGIQAYVRSVTHSFNYSDGGGFTTSATVIAPSAVGRNSGFYGLPRGGQITDTDSAETLARDQWYARLGHGN